MKQLVLTAQDTIRLRGLGVITDAADTLPQLRSWQLHPVRVQRVEQLKAERATMFAKIAKEEREHRADARLLHDVMRVKQGLPPVSEGERMIGDLMRQVAVTQDLHAGNQRLRLENDELAGELLGAREECQNLSIDAAESRSARNLALLVSVALMLVVLFQVAIKFNFWR